MKINSPIKWHGGKYYLVPKLLEIQKKITTPIITRAEHFGGSLAWTLAQDPEGVSEVANDLNGQLTNFWRVLQADEYFAEFSRLVESTPFSEVEFEKASQWLQDFSGHETDNYSVSRAWHFFIVCRQSLSGRMKGFASLSVNRTRRGMNEQVSAWLTAIEGLPEVHSRLKRIFISCRDFAKSIEQCDAPTTLHYCDPSYLPETRTAPNVYEHEMATGDHRRLLVTLLDCKGKVMLSGYDNEMYNGLLRDWNRTVFELPNNAAGGYKKRRMTEVVWYNF